MRMCYHQYHNHHHQPPDWHVPTLHWTLSLIIITIIIIIIIIVVIIIINISIISIEMTKLRFVNQRPICLVSIGPRSPTYSASPKFFAENNDSDDNQHDEDEDYPLCY